MTDAKVIPFDDDSRRRGGSGRTRARGRKPAPPASGKSEAGGQAPLAAVPEGSQDDGRPSAAASIPAQADGARTAADDDSGATGAGSGTGGPGQPQPPSLGAALSGVADKVLGGPWERKVASGLAFLRRRVTGEYEVDEFGYDAELTDQVLMSLVRPWFETYFRVEVRGIENIPAEGGALVVSNHSGTLPIDGLMTQVAVHDHHPAGRHLRLLAADLVFMLPVVNDLARKAGHTLACTEDAQLLLERGEVVGVMPEGFKGLGKPFAERYKLQRFGRGGFVATALKTKVPIIPCSVVGAEEIYPMVGNSRTLARLLGVPYFPLTPTFPWLGPLGLLPLPTKWTIQFGEPIPTDGYPDGGGGRPDARLQPDRPGARDDPAHAVRGAGGAAVGVLLKPPGRAPCRACPGDGQAPRSTRVGEFVGRAGGDVATPAVTVTFTVFGFGSGNPGGTFCPGAHSVGALLPDARKRPTPRGSRPLLGWNLAGSGAGAPGGLSGPSRPNSGRGPAGDRAGAGAGPPSGRTRWTCRTGWSRDRSGWAGSGRAGCRSRRSVRRAPCRTGRASG